MSANIENDHKPYKKMPLPDIRVDIDEFVWVFNSLEKSWMRVTKWTAKSFHELYPSRYTHWMPDESIAVPVSGDES